MNKFFKDKYSPFDVSSNGWKKKKLQGFETELPNFLPDNLIYQMS